MGRPTNAERREKARLKKEAIKSDNSNDSLSIKNDTSMKNNSDKKRKAIPEKKSEIAEFEEIIEGKTDEKDLDIESQSDNNFSEEKSSVGKFEVPNNADLDEEFSGDNLQEDNDFSSNDFSDENSGEPAKKYDPLEEPVIKRNYTQGNLDNQVNTNNGEVKSAEPVVEPIIPEPTIKVPPPLSGDGSSSTANAVPNNATGQPNTSDPNAANINSGTKQPEQPKQTVNPELKDLTPRQKKEAAEKAADALIEAYAKVMPILPKKLSSFNMRKLENMEMKDEISLNMVVGSDDNGDVTARNYCENVNREVDDIFKITEEMKSEIREPLIEVLLENDIALTPTQRLLMAVGSQVVQMGISTIQLVNSNKIALKTFVQYHQDNKREKAAEMERRRYAEDELQRKSKADREHQENLRYEEDLLKKKNDSNSQSTDSKTTGGSKIDLDTVLSSEQSSPISNNSNAVTMEDVLTEANGGITVEEVQNND